MRLRRPRKAAASRAHSIFSALHATGVHGSLTSDLRLLTSPGNSELTRYPLPRVATKKGAPERQLAVASEAPERCPTCAVQAEFHVPPKVNGRMTWDGHQSSNKGMTSTRPPRPPEFMLIPDRDFHSLVVHSRANRGSSLQLLRTLRGREVRRIPASRAAIKWERSFTKRDR